MADDFTKNPYFYPTKVGAFGKNTSDDVKVEPLKQEENIKLEQFEPTPEENPTETVPGLTSIIIPAFFNNYPVFHQTGNCIGVVREHTDKEKTPYEIILVINGNTGIGFDNFEQTYADKIIPNEENVGYTKAMNQGIRMSKGEYIALLCNDVQVYDHWLEDFQEALQHTDLVMATPMYGKPFARAIEARELRNQALIGKIEETFSDFNDFSLAFTRKSLFDEIGLLDEQFLNYCSDLDFLRRMEKANKKYASTKRVNTHHIIGSTSSGIAEMPDLMNQDKEKLKAKWGY